MFKKFYVPDSSYNVMGGGQEYAIKDRFMDWSCCFCLYS